MFLYHIFDIILLDLVIMQSAYTNIPSDNSRIEPNYLEVIYGESATFTCKSNGSINWHFSKQILLFNVHIYNQNTVLINNSTRFNKGAYVCEGNIKEKNLYTGKEGIFFAKGKLSVKGGSYIKI